MGHIAESKKRKYPSSKRKKNRGQYLALYRQMRYKTVKEPIVEQESTTPSTSHPLASTIIPQKTFSPGLMLEPSDGEKIEESHLKGRPIVNLPYMFSKFSELDRHNPSMDCKFSNLILTGEHQDGLNCTLNFKCCMCEMEFKVSNDVPKSVLRDVISGKGYSQLEETMAKIDVPLMVRENFIKLEPDMAPQIEEAAWREMKEAAEEEEKLAIEMGVDSDGVPIPVECDGSWAERSDRSSYNAQSGLVVSSPIDDVKTVLTKCNNGDAPDDDLVRDFMLPLPREEEKCLYACAAKEMGGFVDGKMDVEAVYGMIKLFHPDKPILIEKGKPVLEQCNAEVKVEQDECEYVFKMATCIKEGRDKLLSTEN